MGYSTAPPRADRTAEVIAVHSARAKFSLHPGASPWLDVTSLQLSYPYVMVERTDEGIFPYHVFTTAREDRQDASEDNHQGIEVRLRRVEVDAGKGGISRSPSPLRTGLRRRACTGRQTGWSFRR